MFAKLRIINFKTKRVMFFCRALLKKKNNYLFEYIPFLLLLCRFEVFENGSIRWRMKRELGVNPRLYP